MTKTCKHCGKLFHTIPSEYEERKYCSIPCFNEFQRIPKISEYYCPQCKKIKSEGDFYYRKNGRAYKPCKKCCRKYHTTDKRRRYINEYNKNAHRRVRQEILNAYGHTCACCGETKAEFLCVDHINNDGGEERRKGLQGKRLWDYIKRIGYPKDRYQLLCHNCNQAKGYYGYCPHQTN